jgi:general secretion pathway protein K
MMNRMRPHRKFSYVLLCRQRGVALLMVLGLVIFLSLIALSFSDTQRLSSQMTANTLTTARLQAAADGAVHRMLFELARPRSSDAQIALNQWKSTGIPYELTENGIQITVSAKSEAAKIDLNFAAEALLKNLFVSVGVAETDADSIVAATKDWTDADNLKRPNGAEADDYRAAGRKTVPANDFFVAIEELQNVMGVTPQIFLAVAPYLTVQSRTAGVDPMTATLDMLTKVPGIDAEQAAVWVEQRDAALRESLPMPALTFSSPYFASGSANIRVHAEARADDGLIASRDASIRLNNAPGAHPQFYLWQRARAYGQSGAPALAPTAPAPAATQAGANG